MLKATHYLGGQTHATGPVSSFTVHRRCVNHCDYHDVDSTQLLETSLNTAAQKIDRDFRCKANSRVESWKVAWEGLFAPPDVSEDDHMHQAQRMWYAYSGCYFPSQFIIWIYENAPIGRTLATTCSPYSSELCSECRHQMVLARHMRKSSHLHRGPAAAYTTYTSAHFIHDRHLLRVGLRASLTYKEIEEMS